MSVEEHKALIRSAYAAINRHDLDAASRYMGPAVADQWRAERDYLEAFFTAFPDCRWEVEDLIAEGERLAGRDTCRGTHRGAFLGVAPTGKAVTMRGLHLWRVAEGKVVEHWTVADQLGLLRQLGAFPVSPAGGR